MSVAGDKLLGVGEQLTLTSSLALVRNSNRPLVTTNKLQHCFLMHHPLNHSDSQSINVLKNRGYSRHTFISSVHDGNTVLSHKERGIVQHLLDLWSGFVITTEQQSLIGDL